MRVSSVFKNESVRKILKYYRKICALQISSALLSWDSETFMPERAVNDHGFAIAMLEAWQKKFLTSKRFKALLKKAEIENSKGLLNDFESGVVRVLNHDLKVYDKLPESFIKTFEKTRIVSRQKWKIARSNNNFKIFKPWLEKILGLTIKKAELLGFEQHPYDALLDLYEEGLTTRQVESLFKDLKPLKQLLGKVLQRQDQELIKKVLVLENARYEKRDLQGLNLAVLKLFKFDFSRQRLDESAHPFTIGISPSDVRITTRYEGFDFKRSLFSTVHEFGHALYDLQIDKALWFTPLHEGASYGFHESQSRFWENMICKNVAFLKLFKKEIHKRLRFTKSFDEQELYNYFTLVKPGLIRVDADEVSYNLHILLRFNLEKALIEQSLSVSELPQAWDQAMEEFLGVKPSNHSEGVLQDTHWSMGAFGYFPSYTIGNVLSAQVLKKLRSELGSVEGLILNKKFSSIKEWLRLNIHKHGRVYEPRILAEKLFNGLKAETFLNYLKNKYLS
ncbi:carboxypeptidase M32 [Candidatus Woesearchaeota archaeon]|nr:carboxypeptidase M32 [Candidatus Woesearchaeota archaeon]